MASAVFVFACRGEIRADDWPQFRGPNCSGISAGTQPLPAELSLDENLLWSADVGDGVGGAIVAGGRVYASGMTGAETVSLLAFDAATGKKLWQRDWPTGPLPEIHLTNSQASSTPAADGERVYFYFTTLGLLAVDAATGADVWHQELPVPFFVFKWGPGMSPVLYQDLVLFCQDDDLFPAMYAFDRATGSLRWKDERLDMAVNYSHPIVCSVDGRDDIVVGGTGLLVGYDPTTGQRRWHAKVMLRNIKTTPVARDGIVYISVQSGGIANQWLRSVDQAETGNNDGRLDKAEMQAFVGEQVIPPAFFEKTFDRGDLDKNGFLEGQELDLAFLSPDNFAGASFTQLGDAAADEYVLAVRGGGEGDVTDSHLLWKHKTKYTDHIVSPLVDDGRMFLVKEGGITTVYDMEEGKSLRGAKRVGNGGNYFASPVVGDGKVYLVNENGDSIVLKNDESYEVLSETNLGDAIIATPAIAEGKIFVRTRSKLMCFGARAD
ncbi:MAG: PQQ-binding-like beta-propeller repeat protein [Pirellulales bacterium]|nr:PQQ-binding-like beta-propeller repeat protein [Pirellulales bacterium]